MTAKRRATRGTRSASFALLLAALSLFGSACVTRQIDVAVHDDNLNQIELRGYVRGGKPIDRGYGHPVTISVQRVSHILGAVEVRIGDRDSHTLYPIVSGKNLAVIAKGVSDGLQRADSSQMIVVKSLRNDRRFGVFSRKYLTSFILYLKDDYLHVKVSRINWELPRDPKAKIPEPRLGEEQMDFRTLPGDGMYAASKQTVAARWRDPIFETASRAFDRKDSGARTRTILFEESVPPEEVGRELPEEMVDRLSPETLRALADLEEQREQGTLSEGDYARKRADLLAPSGR